MPRTSTTQGALARLGFGDPTSAERILGDWDDAHGDALRPLVDDLGGSVARRSAAELRDELLAAAGADPAAPQPVAAATGADPLRLAYRRALLRLAARDLTSPDPLEQLPDIAGELADLADATIETALALARGEVAGWEGVRFGVSTCSTWPSPPPTRPASPAAPLRRR